MSVCMFSCTSHRHRQLLPHWQTHCQLLVLLLRLLLQGRVLPHQHHPQGTCRYTPQQHPMAYMSLTGRDSILGA